MVEFGRVAGKGRIRASTEKLKNQGQYCKMIEIGLVRGKGRIRASTEKLSDRVLKNGKISMSTGIW